MPLRFKHIAIASALAISMKGVAQQPPVRFNVWSDQKVHITGEDIWVDGDISGDVKGIRSLTVRLLDRNGIVVTEADLVPKGFSIKGYLTIPDGLRSDYYFLDCTVAGRRSQAEISPVMVINPRIAPSAECKGIVAATALEAQTGIRIIPDRDKVPTRTEVICRIGEAADLRDLTITVYRQDQLTKLMDSVGEGFHTILTHEAHGQAENEGRVIRVQTTRNGKPIANTIVMATIRGRGYVLATATTNASGFADVIIPIVYDESELVLSPLASPASGISVAEVTEPSTPGTIAFPCLLLRPEMREDIEARVLNSRVLNRYYPEGSRAYDIPNRDTSAFFGRPDYSYRLDDYVRFPNMEEVIGEIIPEVRVVKVKGERILQVLDVPHKLFFADEPLVLLDGIPLRDYQKIVDIDPLLIRSIEVVTHKVEWGNAVFNGIVHFRSYKGDMAGISLNAGDTRVPFHGNQEPARLNTPEKISRTDRMPDLRNLLIKEGVSAEQLKNGVRFYTSDAEGEYRIIVRGRKDNGEYRTGTALLTVVHPSAD